MSVTSMPISLILPRRFNKVADSFPLPTTPHMPVASTSATPNVERVTQVRNGSVKHRSDGSTKIVIAGANRYGAWKKEDEAQKVVEEDEINVLADLFGSTTSLKQSSGKSTRKFNKSKRFSPIGRPESRKKVHYQDSTDNVTGWLQTTIDKSRRRARHGFLEESAGNHQRFPSPPPPSERCSTPQSEEDMDMSSALRRAPVRLPVIIDLDEPFRTDAKQDATECPQSWDSPLETAELIVSPRAGQWAPPRPPTPIPYRIDVDESSSYEWVPTRPATPEDNLEPYDAQESTEQVAEDRQSANAKDLDAEASSFLAACLQAPDGSDSVVVDSPSPREGVTRPNTPIMPAQHSALGEQKCEDEGGDDDDDANVPALEIDSFSATSTDPAPRTPTPLQPDDALTTMENAEKEKPCASLRRHRITAEDFFDRSDEDNKDVYRSQDPAATTPTPDAIRAAAAINDVRYPLEAASRQRSLSPLAPGALMHCTTSQARGSEQTQTCCSPQPDSIPLSTNVNMKPDTMMFISAGLYPTQSPFVNARSPKFSFHNTWQPRPPAYIPFVPSNPFFYSPSSILVDSDMYLEEDIARPPARNARHRHIPKTRLFSASFLHPRTVLIVPRHDAAHHRQSGRCKYCRLRGRMPPEFDRPHRLDKLHARRMEQRAFRHELLDRARSRVCAPAMPILIVNETMGGNYFADGDYADADDADGDYTDGDYADGDYADGNYADGNYVYANANYTDGDYTDANYAHVDYAHANYADASYVDATPQHGPGSVSTEVCLVGYGYVSSPAVDLDVEILNALSMVPEELGSKTRNIVDQVDSFAFFATSASLVPGAQDVPAEEQSVTPRVSPFAGPSVAQESGPVSSLSPSLLQSANANSSRPCSADEPETQSSGDAANSSPYDTLENPSEPEHYTVAESPASAFSPAEDSANIESVPVSASVPAPIIATGSPVVLPPSDDHDDDELVSIYGSDDDDESQLEGYIVYDGTGEDDEDHSEEDEEEGDQEHAHGNEDDEEDMQPIYVSVVQVNELTVRTTESERFAKGSCVASGMRYNETPSERKSMLLQKAKDATEAEDAVVPAVESIAGAEVNSSDDFERRQVISTEGAPVRKSLQRANGADGELELAQDDSPGGVYLDGEPLSRTVSRSNGTAKGRISEEEYHAEYYEGEVICPGHTEAEKCAPGSTRAIYPHRQDSAYNVASRTSRNNSGSESEAEQYRQFPSSLSSVVEHVPPAQIPTIVFTAPSPPHCEAEEPQNVSVLSPDFVETCTTLRPVRRLPTPTRSAKRAVVAEASVSPSSSPLSSMPSITPSSSSAAVQLQTSSLDIASVAASPSATSIVPPAVSMSPELEEIQQNVSLGPDDIQSAELAALMSLMASDPFVNTLVEDLERTLGFLQCQPDGKVRLDDADSPSQIFSASNDDRFGYPLVNDQEYTWPDLYRHEKGTASAHQEFNMDWDELSAILAQADAALRYSADDTEDAVEDVVSPAELPGPTTSVTQVPSSATSEDVPTVSSLTEHPKTHSLDAAEEKAGRLAEFVQLNSHVTESSSPRALAPNGIVDRKPGPDVPQAKQPLLSEPVIVTQPSATQDARLECEDYSDRPEAQATDNSYKRGECAIRGRSRTLREHLGSFAGPSSFRAPGGPFVYRSGYRRRTSATQVVHLQSVAVQTDVIAEHEPTPAPPQTQTPRHRRRSVIVPQTPVSRPYSLTTPPTRTLKRRQKASIPLQIFSRRVDTGDQTPAMLCRDTGASANPATEDGIDDSVAPPQFEIDGWEYWLKLFFAFSLYLAFRRFVFSTLCCRVWNFSALSVDVHTCSRSLVLVLVLVSVFVLL